MSMMAPHQCHRRERRELEIIRDRLHQLRTGSGDKTVALLSQLSAGIPEIQQGSPALVTVLLKLFHKWLQRLRHSCRDATHEPGEGHHGKQSKTVRPPDPSDVDRLSAWTADDGHHLRLRRNYLEDSVLGG